MRRNFLKNLICKACQLNTAPLEIVGGVAAILWGLWLCKPEIDTFNTSPLSYAFMTSVAPEWLWGLLIFIAGLCQLIGISINHVPTRLFGTGITCLARALEELDTYRSGIRSELQSLQKEITALELDLADTRVELGEARKEIRTLTAENRELRKQIEAYHMDKSF